MVKSYWKPQGRSSYLMATAAVLAVFAMGTVEQFPLKSDATALNEKRQSATLASQAFEVIKAERQELGIEIDPTTDPTQSGLVGQLISPVTSNNGHLPAKQLTVNPNFAAVVVDMLKRAGVKQGDLVAVGLSGSFPAINICVHAALETLEAKPVIISSASASQWGANHPKLLWIDMENRLYKNGVFSSRSLAASLGGVEDQAIGMSETSVKLLREGMQRNELPFLESTSLQNGIDQRMQLYREQAKGKPIKAYINVGGSAVSVGTHAGKKEFAPGVNLHAPSGQLMDSVMSRFASEQVPVIHLTQVEDLAIQYGLPTQLVEAPRIGEGQVYAPREYNTWLASGGLLVIVLVLAGPNLVSRLNGQSPATSVRSSRSSGEFASRPANGLPQNPNRSNGDKSYSPSESDPIL